MFRLLEFFCFILCLGFNSWVFLIKVRELESNHFSTSTSMSQYRVLELETFKWDGSWRYILAVQPTWACCPPIVSELETIHFRVVQPAWACWSPIVSWSLKQINALKPDDTFPCITAALSLLFTHPKLKPETDVWDWRRTRGRSPLKPVEFARLRLSKWLLSQGWVTTCSHDLD